ncbi:MAG: alpha/beta hydrolase [Rhodospirillaceae bacterium]|nr:alpha/beta hydrolase [Rhodospirillaceae bacterium]
MTLGPEFLPRAGGARLAYNRLQGRAPGVIFLHGLMSDRGGNKAMALEAHCARRGQAFVRFDLFGHGASSGRFEDGTISRWTEDAIAVIDGLSEGPQALVGSSMGGWVMLRAALARPRRIAALVGIALGPDFTEDLMWTKFSEDQRQTLTDTDIVELPSEYNDGPYRISRQLIEDGRRNLLLGNPIAISCPVRLIQGQQDSAVPWQTSLRVAENITGADVQILLVKDGDHRLSRPADLEKLCALIDEVSAKVST